MLLKCLAFICISVPWNITALYDLREIRPAGICEKSSLKINVKIEELSYSSIYNTVIY